MMMKKNGSIGAVVLAAGQSHRMGSNKLLLPWNGSTIIQQVLDQLLITHIQPIVIVTGGNSLELNAVIDANGLISVNNPNYSDESMLHSVQIGIRELLKFSIGGMLVVLGDQPAIQAKIVSQLIQKFQSSGKQIVTPEYDGHKGHPWIFSLRIARKILKVEEPNTLRTFLKDNESEIELMTVSDPSILSDIDTPEEYKKTTDEML